MAKYNEQQTLWRRNVFDYLIRIEAFKKDMINGTITEDTLESWGVQARVENGTIAFYLNEEMISG